MKLENLKSTDVINLNIVGEMLSGEPEIMDDDYYDKEEMITFTRDTTEDFINARLNDWDTIGELFKHNENTWRFEGFQARKGERRDDFGLVDCGDFRAIIKVR